MFERFTETARHAVTNAQEEAAGLHAGHIGTEHLLLALAGDVSGPAGRALRGLGLDAAELRADVGRLQRPGEPDPDALAAIGIDLDEVRRRVEAAFGPGALDRRGRRGDGGRLPFTAESKRTLELALREALRRGDKSIGNQHILLGLLAGEDTAALAVLRGRGRSAEEVRTALEAEIDPGSGRAAG